MEMTSTKLPDSPAIFGKITAARFKPITSFAIAHRMNRYFDHSIAGKGWVADDTGSITLHSQEGNRRSPAYRRRESFRFCLFLDWESRCLVVWYAMEGGT